MCLPTVLKAHYETLCLGECERKLKAAVRRATFSGAIKNAYVRERQAVARNEISIEDESPPSNCVEVLRSESSQSGLVDSPNWLLVLI